MTDQSTKNDNIIQSDLMDNFAKTADAFYNEIVVKQPRGSMPENLFLEYFLPYLTGLTPIPQDTNVYAEWISIAGSPISEVNILDSTTNEVLYTCPALFDTNTINTTKREPGESFNDIFIQYDMQLNTLPVVANNYLNQELTKKLNSVESLSSDVGNVLSWTEILTKYGYTDITSVTIHDDVEDDLIEYD